MKQIILVFFMLSLIGCGSSAARKKQQEQVNLIQKAEQDKKDELEQFNNFYKLADEYKKKQNYSIACEYAKTSLSHANNTSDSETINQATINKNIFCNATNPQSSVGSTQTQQQSIFTTKDLEGSWYHQEEQTVRNGNVNIKTISVQDFMDNGESIELSQIITQMDSNEFSCGIKNKWEWSVNDGVLNQKLVSISVQPDWAKIYGKYTTHEALTEICNTVKKFLSKKLYVTSRFVIKQLDDEKLVAQHKNSDGQIETNTDYRTTKSFWEYYVP